ncbi:transposase [Actinacidiphila sp. ITFR-21]|uniref:transposase n=1 Tax=Actinacidiphila sp. ITFR-21 TaxID=3075199 RepID=UPI0037D9D0EC
MPPSPRTGVKGGRREKHPRRRIVDAVLYVAWTGCQWRYLPNDFPPWQTVYWYFTWWHEDGPVDRVRDALRVRVRPAGGQRDPVEFVGPSSPCRASVRRRHPRVEVATPRRSASGAPTLTGQHS